MLLAAPFPHAAGMMLTFPTLNGLALAMTERERVPGTTRSMLLMPLLNGVLCAAYIAAFVALSRRAPPTALAWALLAAVTVAFCALGFHPRVREGIAAERQRSLVIAVTTAALLLLALSVALLGGPGGASAGGQTTPAWASSGLLERHALKIALFAACLATFLLATQVLPLSDGVRGVLAGLPIVPFGSLVSVATDTAVHLDQRLAMLRGMAATLAFGPAVAVWFIYGFSRALTRIPEGSTATWPVLVLGWALCGLAIAAAAMVFS